MALSLIIAALSFLALCAGLPAFEAVFSILLLTPIFARLIGMPFGALNAGVYLITIVLLCGTALYLCKVRKFQIPKLRDSRRDWYPIVVFIAAFLLLRQLCLLWPDFISMGERLRDYAILSSTLQSPLIPKEPWMNGFVLNYYLYWYRFGHFLGSLLSLETWETYHAVAAFSLAFYLTAIFQLFFRYLNFSFKTALALAAVIALGANLRGVFFFVFNETHWWGPSRVIAGTINEFPAWSFLLGDLHPHYLNLALIPFLLCMGLSIVQSSRDKITLGALALFAIGVVPLWLYNANAWEIPMWIALIAVIVILSMMRIVSLAAAARDEAESGGIVRRYLRPLSEALAPVSRDEIFRGVILLLLVALSAYSLYYSSRNILKMDYPLRLVALPSSLTSLATGILPFAPPLPGVSAPRSLLSQFFLHWGIPLSMLLISQVALWKSREAKLVSLVMLAAPILAAIGNISKAPGTGQYVTSEAWILLTSLLLLSLIRAIVDIRSAASDQVILRVIVHAIGITALGLILLPEFVYLDDPYGGENERMNTIFKIYSTSWMMLHVYAFYLFARAFAPIAARLPDEFPKKLVAATLLVMSLGFFYRTVLIRKADDYSINPPARGLTALNKRYNGAATIIKELSGYKPAVVLEAQGPAYDNTTHVATLSGQTSYLGWSNHMGLLTHDYGEVQRREQATDQVYKEDDCNSNLVRLRFEKIDYVVRGPYEKSRYPNLRDAQFGCLIPLLEEGEYRLYGVPR